MTWSKSPWSLVVSKLPHIFRVLGRKPKYVENVPRDSLTLARTIWRVKTAWSTPIPQCLRNVQRQTGCPMLSLKWPPLSAGSNRRDGHKTEKSFYFIRNLQGSERTLSRAYSGSIIQRSVRPPDALYLGCVHAIYYELQFDLSRDVGLDYSLHQYSSRSLY
jgi:hypothetical protein